MNAWMSVRISNTAVGVITYGLGIADLDAASDAAKISGECILPDESLNFRGRRRSAERLGGVAWPS